MPYVPYCVFRLVVVRFLRVMNAVLCNRTCDRGLTRRMFSVVRTRLVNWFVCLMPDLVFSRLTTGAVGLPMLTMSRFGTRCPSMGRVLMFPDLKLMSMLFA